MRAKALPQCVEVRFSGLGYANPKGTEQGIYPDLSHGAIEDEDFLFEDVEVAAVDVFAVCHIISFVRFSIQIKKMKRIIVYLCADLPSLFQRLFLLMMDNC